MELTYKQLKEIIERIKTNSLTEDDMNYLDELGLMINDIN